MKHEEEAVMLKQFDQTVKFQNRHYTVAWPWRVYPPPFLNISGGLALGSLRTQYHRLQNQPAFLAAYDKIIQKQLTSEIIEKIPTKLSEQNSYYIPHQALVTPKKTTLLCIMHDASAQLTKNSISLNQAIYAGVTYLEDLASLLIRFRECPIAL